MSSQPVQNNNAPNVKYYSPFKPSSYYGQDAAAAAAARNVRNHEDDGDLRYHSPAYQSQLAKQDEEMKGKDAHRWDKFNAQDDDLGAEAATGGQQSNVAKRGLGIFRSWFGGGSSSEEKTLGKAEANVAERAESDEIPRDGDHDEGKRGFFGGLKDSLRGKMDASDGQTERHGDAGRNTQQEIEDTNFRFNSNGQRLFDNNAVAVNTFGSAGAPPRINDESALMPSARLQRSALICKNDLDAFERCVKKYDFEDDRCKDSWESFVTCNDTIPTKL